MVAALCHYVQLCRYFVSQSSESCSHKPYVLLLNECLFLLTQSGNFWIHAPTTPVAVEFTC